MNFQDIFSSKKLEDLKPKKIIADNREKNSLVISTLLSRNFNVSLKQLPIGDYVINGLVIERKTIQDFSHSIISKRIFPQLKDLSEQENKLIIIEGLEDKHLIQDSRIHQNAIRALISEILLSYQIPIIYSYNEIDTVKYLETLAKSKSNNSKSLRLTRKKLTPEQRIRFILEGFEGIGPTYSKRLIDNLGSLKSIINSDRLVLEKFIGKKSEAFHNISNLEL